MTANMKTIVLLTVLAVLLVSARAGVDMGDFSRYQIILDRAPFGSVQDAPAEAAAAVPPEQSFIRDWLLVAMTDEGGDLQVGLVNKQNNNYYMVRVGEEVEGVTVLEADYEGEAVQLQKGSEKHWLAMGDAESGGLGSGGSGVVPGGGVATGSDGKSAASRRASRRRETTRMREVEPPKLTGEDLQKHLQDYNVDLIRKGEPPLPIPLTKEQDDQLVKEGVLPPLN